MDECDEAWRVPRLHLWFNLSSREMFCYCWLPRSWWNVYTQNLPAHLKLWTAACNNQAGWGSGHGWRSRFSLGGIQESAGWTRLDPSISPSHAHTQLGNAQRNAQRIKHESSYCTLFNSQRKSSKSPGNMPHDTAGVLTEMLHSSGAGPCTPVGATFVFLYETLLLICCVTLMLCGVKGPQSKALWSLVNWQNGLLGSEPQHWTGRHGWTIMVRCRSSECAKCIHQYLCI